MEGRKDVGMTDEKKKGRKVRRNDEKDETKTKVRKK